MRILRPFAPFGSAAPYPIAPSHLTNTRTRSPHLSITHHTRPIPTQTRPWTLVLAAALGASLTFLASSALEKESTGDLRVKRMGHQRKCSEKHRGWGRTDTEIAVGLGGLV
ncbi:hypothetical protein DFS34DRAFT_650447 [Phlyctochytrium arcticum]|nr:hypothetical protein DFS34DRAFT_650447 [Phlyctochytrium arcticum]